MHALARKLQPLFPLVLVGLPGAGKTSVGRHLATALDVTVVDSDSEIKRRARATIPQLFEKHGEAGFRQLEYAAIKHSLSLTHGVLALGGGAVTLAKTRELLQPYTVIYLRATVNEVCARIGEHSGRPLIDGDVQARLERLYSQRAELYEQVADITIETDGKSVSTVAAEVLQALTCYLDGGKKLMPEATSIGVTGASNYQVYLGRGLHSHLAQVLPKTARRALILHPPALTEQAQALGGNLPEVAVSLFCHPDGEAAKTIDIANQCWQLLGEKRFGREDIVIGFGGGATTDLAGFVASTWLRGIGVVQLPTTLLAMVDAAIGGKTGVNSPAGKNLIGSFYPPLAVLADLDSLATLPEADFIAGSGEVIKCGFIRDRKILELLQGGGPLSIDHPHLADLIARSVQVKADVVSVDLKESGLREILNYGHTCAHAIEKLSDYQVAHGCAVAIGMVFAAHVGKALGITSAQVLSDQEELLARIGLPRRWENSFSAHDAIEIMRSDKKVRADAIRMVFVTEAGSTKVEAVSDMALLEAAWEYIRASKQA